MRRKRIVENKQRNLLEQRKQNLGSVGQKCSEQMNVSTLLVKIPIEWWKIAWKQTVLFKDSALAVNCAPQQKYKYTQSHCQATLESLC